MQSPLFRESLAIITTICNEVPDLVKNFATLGILEVFLKKFIEDIPTDKHLDLVIYFLAVIRRQQEGIEL